MTIDIAQVIAQATGISSVRIALFNPSLDRQSNRLYEAWVGDRHLPQR